jgi:hypothetical protein
MKKILISVSLFLVTLTSCLEKGETKTLLNGNEPNLPEELKGLKVYRVGLSDGNSIKIAILNNKIVSNQYINGKHSDDIGIVYDTIVIPNN